MVFLSQKSCQKEIPGLLQKHIYRLFGNKVYSIIKKNPATQIEKTKCNQKLFFESDSFLNQIKGIGTKRVHLIWKNYDDLFQFPVGGVPGVLYEDVPSGSEDAVVYEIGNSSFELIAHCPHRKYESTSAWWRLLGSARCQGPNGGRADHKIMVWRLALNRF